MATPNKVRLAQLLGVTRPTLDYWIKNPDKIQMGKYRILESLGLQDILNPQNTHYEICSSCRGTGIAKYELSTPTDQLNKENKE